MRGEDGVGIEVVAAGARVADLLPTCESASDGASLGGGGLCPGLEPNAIHKHALRLGRSADHTAGAARSK